MGAAGDTVDIFVIIHLLHRGHIVLAVFDDGKGDVGLERHELSVGIREGDDIVRNQETFVADIEVILLEFTHFILRVSKGTIQRTKRKNRLFFVFQNIHNRSPPIKNG